MLDVYKSWKSDYDKKANDHLLKHFRDTEIDEIIKAKFNEREADEEKSYKKIKLSSENDAPSIVCLPLKFIKLEPSRDCF